MKEEKIVGIYDIDTRELTKLLREHGSMKGKIVFEDGEDIDFVDPNLTNLVAKVSCKEVIRYGNGNKKVVLVDCGVKHNIIRCLLKRDVTVIRVPWDYDFNTIEYDGLFISNGPGDPDMCDVTVEHIRKAMNGTKPIFGICMGNQLLSKAGVLAPINLNTVIEVTINPCGKSGRTGVLSPLRIMALQSIIRLLDPIGNRCLSI